MFVFGTAGLRHRTSLLSVHHGYASKHHLWPKLIIHGIFIVDNPRLSKRGEAVENPLLTYVFLNRLYQRHVEMDSVYSG